MADFDYSDSEYERLRRQVPEPSGERVKMSMEDHRRPAYASRRRFPVQRDPATVPPQPAVVEPDLNVDPGLSTPDDLDRESAEEIEPEQITDVELETVSASEEMGEEHSVIATAYRDTDSLQSELREELEHPGHSLATTSSTGASSASAATGGAAASAPEARPQRDDPDDGQHTESTAVPEQVEPEGSLESDPATTPASADQPAPEMPTPTPEPPAAAMVSGPDAQVHSVDPKRPWLAVTGSEPVDHDDRVYFSHGEDVTVMKKISRPMVDALRTKIAAVTGGEFAEKISAQALITAFVSVKSGYAMDVDENTAQAMRAFSMMEPRLDAIEAHSAEISKDIIKVADVMSRLDKKMRSIDRSTRAIEMVQSYTFTDRVLGGLEGANDTAESIRLNAPKVAHTRKVLRKEAEDAQRIEDEKDGRSIVRGG